MALARPRRASAAIVDLGSFRMASALRGRNIPDALRVRLDVVVAVGQRHALGRRRPLGDGKPRPPFGCRADRPRLKTAAAVRADVEQYVVDAVGAEDAFKGADARNSRCRWQIAVAAFAVRSQLKGHGPPLSASPPPP